MQALQFFQSLWAMEQRVPGQPELPPAEHFERIAAAGYHGVCIDPAVDEIEALSALQPLYERHGLKCMINVFPHSPDEFVPLLAMAQRMNAVQVNMIGRVMPLSVEAGAVLVRRWMREADAAGMPLLFETHRDCTLNDLYYTLQLIDAVPEMRLCADLSHYVIDREMRLPLDSRDSEFMHRILERSDSFQGRVANREQVQVQIGFPQHQAWARQFRDWWAEGIRLWRARAPANATLNFLCELGPPPYAMTDSRQRELSDRWEEALTIRSWIEDIWAAF